MGLALSAESHSLWNTIQREAIAVAAADPVLSAWMHEAIVNQRNLANALAQSLWRSVAAATRRPQPGDLPNGPIATIPP